MRLEGKIGIVTAAASTSGVGGSAFSPVYSMAKSGVVGFVRSLAKRLAPDKIRVNAICPGPIDRCCASSSPVLTSRTLLKAG
jgi:NAD(P)-dependent dehydrogenase (short-subunit alcohol dehydrogenase family)